MYARIATRRGLPFEPVSAAGDDEVVAIYEALAREGAELERLPE
jgi:antitoxin component of RelBE/YafQ-DinJ toxin-antitoxin module